MKKKYVRGFEDYKRAIKEGLNIYEFEDDVKEPIADLDSDTEKAEQATSEPLVAQEPREDDTSNSTETPAAEEAPAVETPEPTEAPVEETPAETDSAPSIDFGDNGHNMTVDEMTTKLDFIDGVIEEYKKLVKKGEVIDPKIQARIQSAFDSIS
jgi:hypothetical protein